MNNTKLLSAGSKIYARKRKLKKETIERIDFDFDARKEFLTGFHKRKLERKKKAREVAIERERVDRLQARAEAREERKRLADSNMAQMAAILRQQNGEDEEDDDNVTFDSDEELDTPIATKTEPTVKEFSTPTSLTTVTVIEDLELDDTYQSSAGNKRKAEEHEPDQEENEDDNKKIPNKTAKKSVDKKPKEKKKKFRYETKAVRNTNQNKAKNSKMKRNEELKTVDMEYFTAQATEIFSTLPEGNLPRWLLFTSALGIFNSVQNFFTDKLTKQVYANKPNEVTPLSGRLFATWTWSVSMIRIYAAFHLNNKIMYDLGIWSYVIALTHFVGELVVFGGCKVNVPFMSPMIVAVTSLTWMISHYDQYVKY
ncbi:ergosterol biosynthesis protein [Umbelopsis sp. WA50703]